MGQEEEDDDGRWLDRPIKWRRRRTAALIQRTLRVRAKLQARGGGQTRTGRRPARRVIGHSGSQSVVGDRNWGVSCPAPALHPAGPSPPQSGTAQQGAVHALGAAAKQKPLRTCLSESTGSIWQMLRVWGKRRPFSPLSVALRHPLLSSDQGIVLCDGKKKGSKSKENNDGDGSGERGAN